MTLTVCSKCSGNVYNDEEDEANVCLQCGYRYYYGKVGSIEDVEGRRQRKGVKHKYEPRYYNGEHSSRNMFR